MAILIPVDLKAGLPPGQEGSTERPLDPHFNDLTARVTAEINGVEYANIRQYSYSQDILQLGDPCAVDIPNPTGQLNGKIKMGQPFKLYIADPNVGGGKKILMMRGIVTSRNSHSNRDGTVVTVGGCDLGWLLSNSDAPLWFRLRNVKFSQLLSKCIDPTWLNPTWGFQGYRLENDTHRELKLGRQGAVQSTHGSIDAFIPPIQTEPGEKVADLLILYARREKKLVNVSSDGYLQLWAPNYKQAVAYKFHYHRRDEGEQVHFNNVEAAQLEESSDGLYTLIQCVGSSTRPPDLQNANNPNEGQFIGTYAQHPPQDLPFLRRLAFTDGDQLKKEQAASRAQWRHERSKFDSWVYTVEVKGHMQNGAFYLPDTMAYVNDTVNGVPEGNYYVTRVDMFRVRGAGTRARITMRLPILAA